MELYWCAIPGGNFGDDLNPQLWPRLFPDLGSHRHDARLYGIGTLLGGRHDGGGGDRQEPRTKGPRLAPVHRVEVVPVIRTIARLRPGAPTLHAPVGHPQYLLTRPPQQTQTPQWAGEMYGFSRRPA